MAERLSQRSPRVLLITGEAGIGKSHLADAATRSISRWWLQMPHPRASAPAAGLRVLARTADSHRLRRQLSHDGQEEPGARRAAIFSAADEVRRQRPVLVIDDGQWADEMTLDWISHSLAGRQPPNWLLLTIRTNSSSAESVLRSLDPLAREGFVDSLALGPLDRPAVRALARQMGRPVSAPKGGKLVELSGGNPLLLTELLRLEDRARSGARDSVSYSKSLSDVVAEQLTELDPGARTVVQMTALAPPPASEDVVRLATGMERDAWETALEIALGAGVLVGSSDLLSFRHELLREAVENSIPLRRRRSGHRAIARTLADHFKAPPAQVAEQLVAAEDFEGALEWLRRATDHAIRSYDHSTAMKTAATALEHCPAHDDDLAVELINQLVQSARLASQPARGLELLEQLRDRFTTGRAGGQVWLGVARLRSYLDDYEGRAQALISAERLFRRWDDHSGRTLALAELAHPVGRALSLDERVRRGEEGLALAEQLEDDFAWAYCAANLAAARFQAGDRSAVELTASSRSRLNLASLRDRNEFLRQSANLAMYQFWLGELPQAMETLTEARVVADEPFWETALAFCEGLVDWRMGNWEAALSHLEPATRDDSVGLHRLAVVLREAIMFEQGEPVSLREIESIATRLVLTDEHLWSALALNVCVELRTWKGEPIPLRGIRQRLEDIRVLQLRAGWQDLLPTIAAQADDLFEQLPSLVGELTPPGQHAQACKQLAEGLHLSKTGSEETAVELLSAAERKFERVGDRYSQARAWEALVFAEPSGARARDAAVRAAEMYSQIGAERSLARHVRRSRKRGLLSRYPIPLAQRGKGAPGLTEREREVAELAGKGYLTKEIAEELVISPGTVRKHLEHVKAKLDVRRKSDLVRLLHK